MRSRLFDAMFVRSELHTYNFLRCRDELSAAWKIFTPVLHAIDRGELVPLQYQAGAAVLGDFRLVYRTPVSHVTKSLPPHVGTRGPPEADVMVGKCGYVRNDNYLWKKPVDRKSGA